jgi:leader peptidase (prepilin peptidase)/N-methyltransferase
MVSLLIIITFIDIDHMIIPFRLTLTGGGLALIWQLYSRSQSLISVGLGFMLGFGLLAIFVFFGGMGGGDAFLGGMLGIYFGLPQTFALLMLSFIIGGLFSMIILLTGRKKRHEKLPFGPFLALAGFIMLLWGPQILNWYGL